MNSVLSVLSREEFLAFSLCAIYQEAGYQKYRMSKFEEYDLYVKNKDFLISENIITFTDTDGRLLALKPDVTLSIIKNNKDDFDGVKKIYYKENVYRVNKGTKSFKEIMQAGLECLGDINDDIIKETLILAVKSLDTVSDSAVLEVSDLNIVSSVLDFYNVSEIAKKKIYSYLGEKNIQSVFSVCEEEGLSVEAKETISKLVSIYGDVKKVKENLKYIALNDEIKAEIDRFIDIVEDISKEDLNSKIIVDFSVVNDMAYYNGVAFKGFIEGVPTGVLSGGQYDKLMQKMNRRSKAIGFAVYLDELSKIKGDKND